VTLPRLFLALAATVLFAAATGMRYTPAAGAQSAGCAVNPAELSIDAEEQAALDAINALRAAAGLLPLAWSATLGQAAAHKSAIMAATGYFSHDDPGRTWLQRIQECGYRASPQVYENLAEGTATGRATVQLWRDSPPHHQSMMTPGLRVAGLARVRGAGGTWYWTAVFGAAPDGTSAGPATPAQPPAPAPAGAVQGGALQPGAVATVAAGQGECLNVRFAPGRASPIAGCLPDGTAVRVIAGPQAADGLTWWLLDGLGWASGEYLVPGGAPGRAPTTSLAAVLRLPPIEEDPCRPLPGAAACDALRLALWLGDRDAWASWLGAPGLSRQDATLAALRFRADQGSARCAALLQGLAR
jgi:uncharacterized protein YkwD